MNSLREERKLLFFTYLLCIVCFANLSLLKQPYDKGALIIGGITCILIAYGHFVIRKFFPDGDKYIFVFASVLTVISIVTIYRIKPSIAIKQVIWVAIGITGYILFVILLPELKRFAKYKYLYLAITIILLGATLAIGSESGGAKSWIFFHGIGFQPSEFAKLTLAAYLAASLKNYKSFIDLFEPAIVVMACLGMLVLQRDLGTALIFFGIAITMLYIATTKFKYVLTCFILFAIGSIGSYKMFGHVRVRIQIWRNPWKYYLTSGYQLIQSFFAISSGGLFGTGLGQGHPEFILVNTTDFIYAVICEEFGLLIGLAIIIIYFLLFYRGMRAAIYVQNKFARLLAVGISTMIACQALVIIGGVTGAIPLTGITLPLVSYGGSSVLITFFSLGILQKISEEELK